MLNTAIYIHVPYCRRRCPYCDFYLVVAKPDHRFVECLLAEWAERRASWHEGVAMSLYFGGGTPSLLKVSELGRLISFFRDQVVLDAEAEITLEANPEDISEAWLGDLLSVGINRLSMGVQSFDDQILRHLGRKHSGEQAKKAVKQAQQAGFNNISVDLIVGVNQQTLSGIKDSLAYLSSINIPHISSYLLTIEENTNFYRRIRDQKMSEPSEDHQVDSYNLVQSYLLTAGYQQYDISSYAKPGFFSRHNQVYWAQGSYLGLGAGAHSMRLLADGALERLHNKAILQDWLRDPINSDHYQLDHLTKQEALRESLAFGLRNMAQGIDPALLALRHQCELAAGLPAVLEKMMDSGYLEEQNGRLRISSLGALFADSIMRQILCA